MALTVSGALIASLVVDHFGWFRMDVHPVTLTKLGGAVLLIAGVFCITRR
jgi:bacterial/archaeal transporter family-2 protein